MVVQLPEAAKRMPKHAFFIGVTGGFKANTDVGPHPTLSMFNLWRCKLPLLDGGESNAALHNAVGRLAGASGHPLHPVQQNVLQLLSSQSNSVGEWHLGNGMDT